MYFIDIGRHVDNLYVIWKLIRLLLSEVKDQVVLTANLRG